MAENKKSFVLYADMIKSLEHLTNEEMGVLFRHLFDYVNDKNPILTDRLLLTAWKPIELTLKRDLVKFIEVKSKRSEAGKRSAELRALKFVEQASTNSTSVESVEQASTNSTDSVNVNDSVNDNVNDSESVINTKAAPPNVFLNNLNLIELSNLLLENQEHSELFAMLYPNLDFKATIEQFYTHKVKGGVLTDSYNNFTRHFFNWIKVK